MAISRNIYAKSLLSKSLSQRYRNSKNVGKNNSKLEKQQLLDNFTNRVVDDIIKRQKFPQPDYIIKPIICDFVNTGFEDECNYVGKLIFLDDITDSESFETQTTEVIGSDLFYLTGLYDSESFETQTTEVIGDDLFQL